MTTKEQILLATCQINMLVNNLQEVKEGLSVVQFTGAGVYNDTDVNFMLETTADQLAAISNNISEFLNIVGAVNESDLKIHDPIREILNKRIKND